jgi:hypothetical protein
VSHAVEIRRLVQSMFKSDRYHAVLISGPPGYGKTSAVDQAIAEEGACAVRLGVYSTPLGLFTFLEENSDRLIVIDDSSGFYNESSMAILKAATFGKQDGRTVRWDTLTSRTPRSDFTFSGKFIIICNAIRSRSFLYPINITSTQAKHLLNLAASDPNWYADTKVAGKVAQFLIERITDDSVSSISYRTLEKGYELAIGHPYNWKDLLIHEIPTSSVSPECLVKDLAKQDLKVKDQVRIFEQSTGLKRRTFFKYRSQTTRR